jgi:hypothetical protein
MLEQAEPRVEFRIFDLDLKSACRMLVNAAQDVVGRVSSETYIVTRLTIAAIVKIRIFEVGHCRAELTDLEFPDGRIETAAIESGSAEETRELVWRAGLEARLNESYAAYLQRRLFPVVLG